MKVFNLFFSFDDGYKEDLRVAELLEKYGFTGTFFISTKTELSEKEILRLAAKHKIGGHTVTHPMDLKLVDDERLKFELEDNREWLQGLTGQPIGEFCYPRGRYDDRVIEAVKRAGFNTARTTEVEVYKYNFADPFRIPTTAHIYNRFEYDGVPWQEMARRLFQKAIDAEKESGNGYYHLWGHSKIEIERYNWWEDFDSLLKYIHENISREQ